MLTYLWYQLPNIGQLHVSIETILSQFIECLSKRMSSSLSQ